MAGLQPVEGHMMIDSVVWAQYINVTDTRTDRQLRRHSTAAPMHCVRWQKHRGIERCVVTPIRLETDKERIIFENLLETVEDGRYTKPQFIVNCTEVM